MSVLLAFGPGGESSWPSVATHVIQGPFMPHERCTASEISDLKGLTDLVAVASHAGDRCHENAGEAQFQSQHPQPHLPSGARCRSLLTGALPVMASFFPPELSQRPRHWQVPTEPKSSRSTSRTAWRARRRALRRDPPGKCRGGEPCARRQRPRPGWDRGWGPAHRAGSPGR